MSTRALISASVDAAAENELLDVGERTLDRARALGVEGAMMFWDHGLLYCLEGDHDALEQACALIEEDPSHRAVDVILRLAVERPVQPASPHERSHHGPAAAIAALRRLVEAGAIQPSMVTAAM